MHRSVVYGLSPSPAASWSSGILPSLFCLSLVAQYDKGQAQLAFYCLICPYLLTFAFQFSLLKTFFVVKKLVNVVSG